MSYNAQQLRHARALTRRLGSIWEAACLEIGLFHASQPTELAGLDNGILELRVAGMGLKAIARQLGIGTGTVQRVDLVQRQKNIALEVRAS